MSKTTTPEELERLGRKWQEILRLQDWDVEFSFARQSDIDDADARCFPHLSRKEAKIKILDPLDFHGERLEGAGSPQNIEMLVVHELIHLHFEPFWKEKHETEMEQAIHSLAKAFLAATTPPKVPRSGSPLVRAD